MDHDDMIQATIVRFLEASGSFNGKNKGYFSVASRNAMINEMKKNGRPLPRIAPSDHTEQPSIEIESLPLKYHSLFRLFSAGYSSKDIINIMDISYWELRRKKGEMRALLSC